MVFNFHASNSYTNYRVGTEKPGNYKVRGCALLCLCAQINELEAFPCASTFDRQRVLDLEPVSMIYTAAAVGCDNGSLLRILLLSVLYVGDIKH